MRFLRGTFCLFLALASGVTLFAAGEDLKELQRQLTVVENDQSTDNAALAEITRRILELDPKNGDVWEKRARALLQLDDLKQCGETLDGWEKQDKKSAATIADLRGDIANSDEKYEKALQYWNTALPLLAGKADTYEKIAKEYEREKHWDKVDATLSSLIAWRQSKHLVTRQAEFEDSADTHVWRARARLELHRWNDALADIKKANALDATDPGVKEWLPKFERLEKSLPQLKELDQKIAQGKNVAPLLLDRGLFFTGLELNDLALEDADAALAAAPQWKQARLQKAQALVVLNRIDEAAKLKFITKNNKFSKPELRKVGALDFQIDAKPGDAALFVLRARECSDIEQFAIAMEDAQEAVKLDPKSAEALVELGFAGMKMGNKHKAQADFTHATELDPNNAVAWRSLGELAMDRADFPAAIENFTRSLKLHESPLVLKKREQCYRYSQHVAEADEDLQRWQKLATKPAAPQPNKK